MNAKEVIVVIGVMNITVQQEGKFMGCAQRVSGPGVGRVGDPRMQEGA